MSSDNELTLVFRGRSYEVADTNLNAESPVRFQGSGVFAGEAHNMTVLGIDESNPILGNDQGLLYVCNSNDEVERILRVRVVRTS